MANPVIRQSDLIVTAGIREYFALRGNFVRLMSASDPVRMFIGDSEVVLDAGEAIFFDNEFDRIGMEHDAVGNLAVTVRVGFNARDDSTKIGGGITALPSSSAGAATHAGVVVTAASAQILAANANRKFLMLQNRDPAVTVYFNLSGAAVTASDAGVGIKLSPGEKYESAGAWVSTAAITAIGSALMAAANLLIVEGD